MVRTLRIIWDYPYLKVPYYNDSGTFRVECYNDNKERIKDMPLPNLITKGHNVRAIVKCGGVWFAGGKFGTIWELVQIKTTPKDSITEYAFQEEDDDADVEEDNTTTTVPETTSNYVLDSEDEDDL